MSQTIAKPAFRNAHIAGLSAKHIAALEALHLEVNRLSQIDGIELSIDDSTRSEAQELILGVIALLSHDEHFVYRLTNAAAGAR